MKKFVIFFLSLFLIIGCGKKEGQTEKTTDKTKNVESGDSKSTKKTETNDSKSTKKGEENSDRDNLVKKALEFENNNNSESEDYDKYSSGFVKMLYLENGVDLTKIKLVDKKDAEGNWLSNVEVMAKFMEQNGSLYKDRLPKKGDVVFFGNTFDRNKDSEINDPYTNMGIVIDVDDEETVHFLMKMSDKIQMKQLNLKNPAQPSIKDKNLTKTINSQLRWISSEEKKAEKTVPQYAGELFLTYGTILDGKTFEQLKPKREISESQRDEVVKFALSFEGKELPKSEDYSNTSSGFIKMIYINFELNVFDIPVKMKKDENDKWRGGTELAYLFAKDYGKIYESSPKKGDVIFFDNSYDENKDGILNDKLTGIGFIVEVDKEETIHYLTKTSKGIEMKQMNLKMKDQASIKDKNLTKTINSQTRWQTAKEKKDGLEVPTLAGQQFNSFGSFFK